MMEHRDVFVSGLARVELLGGGCARFVCYTVEEKDGEAVERISLTFVVPVAAVGPAVRKAMAATGGEFACRVCRLFDATIH